jgi:hypothetical protein
MKRVVLSVVAVVALAGAAVDLQAQDAAKVDANITRWLSRTIGSEC